MSANASSYPPRFPQALTAPPETAEVEPAGDLDENAGALAQAVDETLDACSTAWEEGRMDTARALLTSAMAVIDELLDALGVSDPDEN